MKTGRMNKGGPSPRARRAGAGRAHGAPASAGGVPLKIEDMKIEDGSTENPPLFILALDPGENLGWAGGVASAPNPARSGQLRLKESRFEGGGMRFLRLLRWLEGIDAEFGIDMIAFEKVAAHKGTDAAHVYGGMVAIITAWCEMKSIPYCGIPVGRIKKHATGVGNSDKDGIGDAMRARGLAPDSHDEADAQAIWLLARETMAPNGKELARIARAVLDELGARARKATARCGLQEAWPAASPR